MTTAHDAGPAVPERSDGADGQVSRRQLVRGVAIAGTVVAAGAGLAACTSSPQAAPPVPKTPSGFGVDSGSGAGSGATTSTGTPKTGLKTTTLPTPDKPPTTEADEIPSFVVAKTSAIPVGGGVVYPSRGVVVTQPKSGEFKCFNATCTHLGCTVNKVSAGLIRCPCHGARFSIVDGAVKAGPAPRPLVSEGFSIKNGEIVLD